MITPEQFDMLKNLGIVTPRAAQVYSSLNSSPQEPPAPPPEAVPPPAEEPAPAETFDVEKLLDRTRTVESNDDPNAVSKMTRHGVSRGPYQLNDATGSEYARRLNIPDYQPHDELQSRSIARAFYADLHKKYGGNLEHMVAAYNAGEPAVDDAIAKARASGTGETFNDIAPFLPQETQNYVPRILGKKAEEKRAEQAASDGYDVLASMTRADQLRREAIGQGVASGIKKASEEQAYLETLQKKEEERQALAVQRQQEQQRTIEEQNARLDQALNDYRNTHVDPNRYWNEKSTGQKILAGFAIFLGGIGASAKQAAGGGDGKNRALDIINDAITRDIESQKTELNKKGEVLNAEGRILDDMRSRFKDENAAELAARNVMLDGAQRQLQILGAKYQTDEIQAKAKELYAGLDEQKAKNALELQKLALSNPIIQQAQRNAVLNSGQVELLPEEDRRRVVKDSQGQVVGLARSADDAKALSDAYVAKSDADALLDQLISLRNESTGSVWPSVQKKANRLASELRLKIKDMYKLGALNAQDYQALDAIVPVAPLALVNVGLLERLKQMKSETANSFQRQLNTRLSQPTNAGKNQTTDVKGGAVAGF